jgi:hypothetical protein
VRLGVAVALRKLPPQNTSKTPREYQENTKGIRREYEENTKTTPESLRSNRLATGLYMAWQWRSLTVCCAFLRPRTLELLPDSGTAWNLPERLSKSSVSFPLTPALSLGERESATLRPIDACRHLQRRTAGHPLLWGEGRGEGEQGSR